MMIDSLFDGMFIDMIADVQSVVHISVRSEVYNIVLYQPSHVTVHIAIMGHVYD